MQGWSQALVTQHLYVIAFVTLISGCIPPIDPVDQGVFDEICNEVAQEYPLPESVPEELLSDVSDPQLHPPILNTLRLVPIGTVIDDLSGLDGCWARQDPDDWGITHVSREVMRFELSRNQMTHYRLLTPTLLSENFIFLPILQTDLPYFDTNVWEVSIDSNNLLGLTLLSGEGAAINSEGKTVFSCLVAGGGSWENDLSAVLTLDGDSLKYFDYYEDIDPADPSNELSAEYWVRVECP